MRAPWFVVVLVILVSASVCVRLGFWQISRLHEKRALNAALRQAENAPPIVVSGEPPPAAQASHRALAATGRFDEAHQFLLSGRSHRGAPGVEVVTPFRVEGARTALLVNRGWLPAPDAATARPDQHPEPGERTVRGIAEDLRHGAGGRSPRVIPVREYALWSVRWLDQDSVAARLPYPIAGYVLRQSPGPGVPDMPRRSVPQPYNEMTHLSYAIQWFLFATIMLGGSAALAWSRRRAAARLPAPEVSR
jgi:surfeit locus 1 family protein